MTVVLIVAVADNRVIGRSNALPWYLPADLKHFKQLTTGHTIVMGRKTWESIGRPLPNRRSIVISGSKDFRPEGVTVVSGMEAALENAREDGEVFVIGGARVFAAAFPFADRLEITRVHAAIEGDVHFPEIDLSGWRLVNEEHHLADANNAHRYSFQTWRRRSE